MDKEKKTKKLAGWKVFLIVIVVLLILFVIFPYQFGYIIGHLGKFIKTL